MGGLIVWALFLRARQADMNPPGFFCDEAAAAWNAACLWSDGCNDQGERWPLFFPWIERFDPRTGRSEGFTDDKAPLFIYSTVPAVAWLGPTRVAVRLTAALWGTVLVPIGYLLGRRFGGVLAGFVAAGLLTVTPWSLSISRIGFESISMVPLIAAGILIFLRAGGRRREWILSGLCFAGSAYAYSPARLFAPSIMLALAVTHAKPLLRRPGCGLLWAATALLCVMPMLFQWDRLATRWSDLSVRRDDRGAPVAAADAVMLATAHYLRCCSPAFLFISGDPNPRHALPNFGELFWCEGLLAAIGLCRVLRVALASFEPGPDVDPTAERLRRAARFLLLWLLIWPIPASLTRDGGGHALRTLTCLPLPQVLAGCGLATLIGWIRAATDLHLSRGAGPAGSGNSGRRVIVAAAATLALFVAVGAAWFQMPRYFTALFRDAPHRRDDAFQSYMLPIVSYGDAAVAGGRCARIIASPSLTGIRTFICVFGNRTPAEYLRGVRPPFWIGEIPPLDACDRHTLLLLSPADLARFFPRTRGNALRTLTELSNQSEQVVRDGTGQPQGIFVRADRFAAIVRAIQKN